MTEREGGDAEAHERPKLSRGMKDRTSTLGLSGNGSKEWAERGTKVHTLGFEPSCACHQPLEDTIDTWTASRLPAPTVPGVVLDPFAGAGTTGMVALRRGRSFVGIELNPEYADLARWRIRDDIPDLNQLAEFIPR
jgi:hypothetical protein